MKSRQLAIVLVSIFTLHNVVTLAQSPSGTERQVFNRKSRADEAIDIVAVRNLQDSNWLERLEVEVKNLSNKPVYSIEILISFPDVQLTDSSGVPATLAMRLCYGRKTLRKEVRANAEDTPINPGGSYVFKISQENRKVLQDRLASGVIPASAVLRVNMRVYELSFGDGTGFYAGGVPFP